MRLSIPFVSLVLSALLLVSCAEEQSANGTDGTGGTDGMPTGGTGGTGTGGTGGDAKGNCGYGAACTAETDTDAWCADNVCGGLQNIDTTECNITEENPNKDDQIVCNCVTGECSRDDCFDTSDCTSGPDRSFCLQDCATACGGEGQVRDAFCATFPGDTSRCECVCRVGAAVSCPPPPGGSTCTNDGNCSNDDCVCPDCDDDLGCLDNCFINGDCQSFQEGCVCADCATHPECVY